MKKHIYYITFFHSNGNGYSVLERDDEIKTLIDLQDAIQTIEKINNISQVVPINWVRLEVKEVV